MAGRMWAHTGLALAALLAWGALAPADAGHRAGEAFREQALHGGHEQVFATETFEARRLYRSPFQANPFAAGAPPMRGAHAFSDSCHRIKRGALATGSRVWWDRYDACRGGDRD